MIQGDSCCEAAETEEPTGQVFVSSTAENQVGLRRETYATLTSASDTLERLGVQVIIGECEHIERLAEEWSISRKKSKNNTSKGKIEG